MKTEVEMSLGSMWSWVLELCLLHVLLAIVSGLLEVCLWIRTMFMSFSFTLCGVNCFFALFLFLFCRSRRQRIYGWFWRWYWVRVRGRRRRGRGRRRWRRGSCACSFHSSCWFFSSHFVLANLANERFLLMILLNSWILAPWPCGSSLTQLACSHALESCSHRNCNVYRSIYVSC